MALSKNLIQQYNTTQYTPVAVESFDFPVGADLIEFEQLSIGAVQWHWHEEIEFVVAKKGLTKIQLPDQSLTLSPGDGIFLTCNLLHSVYSAGQEDSSFYTLKCNPAFLFGYGQTSLFVKYIAPVLDAPNMQFLVLKKDMGVMDEMLTLIHDCIKLYNEKGFGYELKIKSNICQLWVHLLSFSMDASRTTPAAPTHASLDNKRIKTAILFIQERYMDSISLEDIANSIHVSKSECCRCFQRALGLTPFDYLLKYRIFASTRKIMHGDEIANSISSLAASVGFNNASYYNKLFKKYMGCTPTEYKKNMNFHSKTAEDIF